MVKARSLVVLATLALAGACTGSSSTTTVTPGNDPVGDTVDQGSADGQALADQSYGELVGNDYAIQIGKTASILAALNDGEINQSDFAVQVVTDNDVADYANTLITDHQDGNAELDTVIRGYGIGYIPSATADQLAANANANLGVLRSTPPGQIDFQFVDIQVRQHAGALVLLDELYTIVGAGPMGDYIQSTRTMVNDHLKRGEDLLDTYY